MAFAHPTSFLALAFLSALPAAAGPGDFFLDFGTSGLVQEDDRQPAWSGSMGFRFGIGRRVEAGLSAQYGRFLAHQGFEQVELTGADLSASYSLHPGWLQPLVGAHAGMTRLDDTWRLDLGLDLQALAGSRNLLQAYSSLQPGIWIGDEGPELWFKAGLGFRLRLPY